MSSHHLKRLIIMRHAKADWPWGVDDHDRPLEPRGHRDAAAAGAWLRENHLGPDFILSSSALRTRQTTTWICHELGEKAPTPLLEPDLYLATPEKMLAVINHVPETVTALMLVAHMPGVQELVMRLADRNSDQDAYMDAAGNYRTAGITVLSVEGSWAELDGQDATITHFEVPRA